MGIQIFEFFFFFLQMQRFEFFSYKYKDLNFVINTKCIVFNRKKPSYGCSISYKSPLLFLNSLFFKLILSFGLSFSVLSWGKKAQHEKYNREGVPVMVDSVQRVNYPT